MENVRGPVAGVVLAGGMSSRMGRDKALLQVYGPGKPDLLTRTCSLLTDLLPQCWISCRSGLARAGYQCIFDEYPDRGPAAGVLAALKAARAHGFDAVLVVSCDMPFMDAPTLRRLLASRNTAGAGNLATLYVDAVSGRPEALVAVYETASLPWFEKSVTQQGGRLNNVVPAEKQTRLPYGPDEAGPFFNLNRPEDVKRALDILGASL